MQLTKAEEQIMQILWKIEKGFIREILAHFKDPKPAYTTVATIVKIMEKKGYVSHTVVGNAHRFYPVISRKEYSKKHVNAIFKKYFKGSIRDVVSFFADNNRVQVKDIDDAIKVLTKLKKGKK
jgi:BlaI family penicillinase repressor